ncbi:MAG: phosphate/phosphite/phosphonate ABC transporter substrate-binding protein [Leptolyngbya sp. SIO1D8]|nr:phosphate/phosphite/phosphonate ABC transporter substrate-binding protein [Leptolyngbya sp. SIO1D8]
MISISGLGNSKNSKFCLAIILSGITMLTACSHAEPDSTTEVAIAEESVDSSNLEESTSNESSDSTVYFGVLAIRSATLVHERYAPLLEYLSEATGRPFELVTLNQDSQFTQVAEEKLDFITSNPLSAVQIQRLHNTNFLTTLERPNTGSQFSGLIITGNDSGIQTLSDLKGKRVACVDFETAAAGCLFQIYHLLQNDIDPFQDFAEFAENPSQDNIVLAVLNQTIDAGFIRTGQLELMVKKNLIENIEGIKILEPKNDDFFFPHTTDLYPEWPIASLPNTEPALSEAVEAALLNISDDHPALETAQVSSFLPPENYDPIHNMIEALKLKSWDAQ